MIYFLIFSLIRFYCEHLKAMFKKWQYVASLEYRYVLT